jgi:hypothetical protein
MKTTSPSSRINDKETVRAKAVDGCAGRVNRSEGVPTAKKTKPDRKATRLPYAVSWSVHQPSPAVGKGRKGSKGKKPLVSFPGSGGVKCPSIKATHNTAARKHAVNGKHECAA